MTSISDAGSPGGTFSFSYDALGNLTNDGRKGLVISYNVLNLPRSVATAASESLTYTYLSDGTKVSAIKSDGSGERYLGSFVYSFPSCGSETLESAAWDEGRINYVKTGNSYTKSDLWFVNDHLGNVRTVIDISTGLSAPQVLERNDYLPFGTRMDAGTAVMAGNRFRLGGKESQTFGSLDLGKVDFGARMYDPFTARWTTADPLAAKYGSMSPYNYCGGNPINLVDPNGLDWWEIDETGRVVNSGKSQDYDSFYMVNKGEDGSYVRTGESINLNYKSVLSHRAIDYSPRQLTRFSEDPMKDTYDVFTIRGDNNGTRLFEFLVENVTRINGIEMGHIKTGLEGDLGLNFVTASHYLPKKSFDPNGKGTIGVHDFGIKYLIEGQLYDGYTIREINHSHKINNKPSTDDQVFSEYLTNYYSQKKQQIPSFNIFHAPTRTYYSFGIK